MKIKTFFFALICALAFVVFGSQSAAAQDINVTCNQPKEETKLYYLRYTKYGETEGAINDGIATCPAGRQATIGRKYRADYIQKNGGKIGLRVLVGETAYFFGLLTAQPDKVVLTWRNSVPSVTTDGVNLTRYNSAAKMTEALRPQQ